MPQSSSAKRSLGQRLTGKVGPLPAWAWAALLLGAFLLYSRLHSSSSSGGGALAPSTSSSDQTPVTGDTGNPTGSSGQGGPADNVNDTLLSQLSGFQSSVDALTAAVQSAPAFAGTGTSGAADYSGGGSPLITLPDVPGAPAAKPAAAKAAPKPAAKPAAVHYYTYAPGKAPKGKAAQQAPAKVPGKTLHFTKGKGYYYA